LIKLWPTDRDHCACQGSKCSRRQTRWNVKRRWARGYPTHHVCCKSDQTTAESLRNALHQRQSSWAPASAEQLRRQTCACYRWV